MVVVVVLDAEMERRLAAHMMDFFWQSATIVRLDRSFVADGHSFVFAGHSFVAKDFVLRTDDIRYGEDGALYLFP